MNTVLKKFSFITFLSLIAVLTVTDRSSAATSCLKTKCFGRKENNPPQTLPSTSSTTSNRGETPELKRYKMLSDQLMQIIKTLDKLSGTKLNNARAQIESILLEQIALFPDNPFERVPLAKLYEEEGKIQAAYYQWKIVFETPSTSVSNISTEPVAIVHFGDLAWKVGDIVSAERAYSMIGKEALTEVDYQDGAMEDPEIERQMAHYVTGCLNLQRTQFSHVVDDMVIAMPAFKKSMRAHFVFGQALAHLRRRTEARKELKSAESLAFGPDAKEEVHKQILFWNLQ